MFEKFSAIDLIKTRSASVCTFAGNVVKFNIQTAQELRFPEYIQFLIEPKSKQFAIRACKEDAPNAVRFSKPESEQKAQIKISNATVVDMVRKLMDWNAEDNWNVPGIYFAEEQGIMYIVNPDDLPQYSVNDLMDRMMADIELPQQENTSSIPPGRTFWWEVRI